jgi:hypothetical protein
MSETASILDGSSLLVSTGNGDIAAQPDQPKVFFKDTASLALEIDRLSLPVLMPAELLERTLGAAWTKSAGEPGHAIQDSSRR